MPRNSLSLQTETDSFRHDSWDEDGVPDPDGLAGAGYMDRRRHLEEGPRGRRIVVDTDQAVRGWGVWGAERVLASKVAAEIAGPARRRATSRTPNAPGPRPGVLRDTAMTCSRRVKGWTVNHQRVARLPIRTSRLRRRRSERRHLLRLGVMVAKTLGTATV